MTQPKIDTTLLDHADASLVQHDIHQAWWRLELMQREIKKCFEEEYNSYFDHPIAKKRLADIVDEETIKDAIWFLQRALTWIQKPKRPVMKGQTSEHCIHFNEDGSRRTREEVHALMRIQFEDDSTS